MCRRCIGAVDHMIQLIEIGLRHVTSALRARIGNGDGDDSALFVLIEARMTDQRFACVYAIPLVIHGLKLKAVDQVACYRVTLQKIDKKRTGIVPAKQARSNASENIAAQCPTGSAPSNAVPDPDDSGGMMRAVD